MKMIDQSHHHVRDELAKLVGLSNLHGSRKALAFLIAQKVGAGGLVCSQAGLADMLGVCPRTVGNIVADLRGDGVELLLIEVQAAPKGGRLASIYRLNVDQLRRSIAMSWAEIRANIAAAVVKRKARFAELGWGPKGQTAKAAVEYQASLKASAARRELAREEYAESGFWVDDCGLIHRTDPDAGAERG